MSMKVVAVNNIKSRLCGRIHSITSDSFQGLGGSAIISDTSHQGGATFGGRIPRWRKYGKQGLSY